ncbi:hypothetical protein R1sor_011666 [Riccia sorocarpa]|uniref:Protein kinase domain-containing protein n=1 Tax=Riccia sorocarpa TaxID=122646 RepID=A0ABD3I1H6_9MARC
MKPSSSSTMRRISLVPVTLFWTVQVLVSLSRGNAALLPEEENVLEILQQRFNAPSWTGDACEADVSWIRCSNDSRHVSSLQLGSLNTSGSIPPEVAQLRNLEVLFMFSNKLTGPIPDLRNITGLTNLDLKENSLSGPILNTTAFTNITRIVLYENILTGGIPEDLFKHRRLKILYLGNNPLGGSLPDMSELTSMTEFSLPNISINGTIPESIQNMTQATLINLYDNPELKGQIPNLSALVNLQYLDFHNCSLTGPLQDLKAAPNLVSLILPLNDLGGTIPPSLFDNHPDLKYLELNNNSKISGEIPDTGGLTMVENFFLNDCNLTGPVPPLQKNLNLRYVGLQNNHLTSCPTDLRNLTELIIFDVSNNSITGTLPEVYPGNKINFLTFRRNNFHGGIPMTWTNLTSVLEFKVEYNNLSGVLQPETGNVGSLKVLLLNNNRFSGPIPKDLGRLNKLEILDLSHNQFTGQVPEELAALPNLRKVLLHSNKLDAIPEALIELQNRGLNLTYDPGLQVIRKKASAVSGGIIAGIAVGVAALIGGLLVLAFVVVRTRRKRRYGQLFKDSISTSIQAFSHKEIKRITDKYKIVLGRGGYGTVYYGKLPDGKEVAVKVRETASQQGAAEFLTEVRLLSKLHHRNLVPLVGYSLEGGQQTLVYEYMAQGTLHSHLYRRGGKALNGSKHQGLSWRTRLHIAVNAAKGLEYLHKDCNPPVIHRDVKASNILLTETLQAKISDLGLSKQLPEPKEEESTATGISTAVKGTFGYLDPEYFVRHRLTIKSDVFSFGVVLLELITGRRPGNQDFPDADQDTTLIEWVQASVCKMDVESVVDPAIGSAYKRDVMLEVVNTALSCVLPDSGARPDMSSVQLVLTEALQVENAEALRVENESTPAERTFQTLPLSGPLSFAHFQPSLSSPESAITTLAPR